MATLITGLFFASGLAALAYEIVWVRALGLVVGNSLWGTTVVVAAYMGGMALGGALTARFGHALRRHLRWYAAAEAVAAIFALATPWALGALARVAAHLGGDPLGGWGFSLAGRFAVAWLFLLVPTAAMGATLPLLVESVRRDVLLGRRVSGLYAANTFGAVTGVIVASFLALPFLGERATLSLAASVGLIVAGVAWFTANRIPTAPTPDAERQKSRSTAWLAIPALLGFVALASELVWTRLLLLHLGSRVYAFAVILAVYLAGLALGAAVARRWMARPREALAVVETAIGLILAVQLCGFLGFDDLAGWFAATFRITGFVGLEVTLALAVAVVILPPTILFGASFPLTIASYPATGSETERTGAVVAANTLGGVAGSIAGPLVLVPLLGSVKAVAALALLSVAVALVLTSRRRVRTAAFVVVPLVLATALLVPADAVLRGGADSGGGVAETIRESASATVVVRRIHDARGEWRSLELNGVNVAGTSPELRAIQRLQGHLPLLLHPHPRRVLHIGFGSGGTAYAVAQHPVDEIVIAEISPEVLQVSSSVFGDINHGVLSDPRVRVVVNDGRNVLLASRERFDVILSDSIHPVYAGNSTLYTEEYFRLCRDHLTPGGVVSMWLPMYSLTTGSYLAILRAFSDVFPQTCVWYDPLLVNEFTIVTGRAVGGGVNVRWDAVADPRIAGTLAEAGVRSPADLGRMLMLGPAAVAALVADIPPHVDNFPEVEYLSGRVLDRERSWLDNFAMLIAARSRRSPFASAPFDVASVFAVRDRLLAEQRRVLQARLASR